MIKGVLIFILLLLSVSGLCDLIHTIRCWIISSKRPRNNICTVYLNSSNTFSQLRFVLEQYRWYGGDFSEYIVAITDELSDDEVSEYEQIFDKSKIIFCPSSSLANVLKSLKKGN